MVTSQNSFKFIPILLLAFLTACAMAESRGGGGGGKVGNRIYVVNQGANTVSFIDATSHAVIKTVQLDVKGPHDLALTRDGRTLYVTTLLSGYVVVIDTATFDIVTTIPTGNRAHSMALTNDQRQLWVVNIGENNVSIIDLEKLRIVGTVPVGRLPGHIRFSKDGRFAYVTSQQDEQVIVLDTSTLAVVKTVAVGKMPHFLIPSTDDKLLWGGNSGGNDVYVIDMSTNERIGSIEVGAKPQHIAFGVRGMFGPFAYVAVQGTDEFVREVGLIKTDLDTLISSADYISFHVPFTNDTKHLVNSQRIAKMKKTTFIINTSRGEIIDEEALYSALKDGKIAGAALDVFEKEPATGNKLATLPNVICTPHIGAQTKEAQTLAANVIAEKIIMILRGVI